MKKESVVSKPGLLNRTLRTNSFYKMVQWYLLTCVFQHLDIETRCKLLDLSSTLLHIIQPEDYAKVQYSFSTTFNKQPRCTSGSVPDCGCQSQSFLFDERRLYSQAIWSIIDYCWRTSKCLMLWETLRWVWNIPSHTKWFLRRVKDAKTRSVLLDM